MRLVGFKRRLRAQERKHKKPEATAWEHVVHDPQEPGAWKRLLAAVRAMTRRGSNVIVSRVVAPPGDGSAIPPPAAPLPHEPERETSAKPEAKTKPKPTYDFSGWSMAQLWAHLQTCIPMPERIAAENEWNRKNHARRDSRPMTDEEEAELRRREHARLVAERLWRH